MRTKTRMSVVEFSSRRSRAATVSIFGRSVWGLSLNIIIPLFMLWLDPTMPTTET